MDEQIIDLEEIVEKQAWQLYMTSRKKGFPKKRKEVNIEFDWRLEREDITVLTCVCVHETPYLSLCRGLKLYGVLLQIYKYVFLYTVDFFILRKLWKNKHGNYI
jgi:hypothetical protein